MVWNDQKYHLIHECRWNTEKKLKREIIRWKTAHKQDIAFCNSKFDHLFKVVDRVIAFIGRATGL